MRGAYGEMNSSIDKNLTLGNHFLASVKNMYDSDAVYATDLDGHFIQINTYCEKVFGYQSDQLLSKPLMEIVNLEDIDRVSSFFMLAREGKFQNFDCQIIDANGSLKDVNFTKFPIVLDGDVVGVYGVVKDITEIKQKRQMIKESEVLYQLITDNSLDMITKSNMQGEFLYVSPFCFDLLGYTPDQLIGKSSNEIIHTEDLEKVLLHREVVTKNYHNGAAIFRMKHRDGNYIWVESLCKSIFNENNGLTEIISVVRDVSERMKTQELLLNSEKLSVAGQLAAGIAHEVRNPLTAIKGFLQLMESNEDYRKSYFEIINTEINRIELILNELLLLSKPQDMKFKKGNLMEMLLHVKALIDTHANMNNIQVELMYSTPIRSIICDENQLKQVFINFLKNSIEAMPSGGKIIINVENEEPNQVKIGFIDQGCGIPKEYLDRIGQPFFTTKENGTGLGLMISSKIIENHHGKLIITSNNSGTMMEIILPTGNELP